MTETQAGTEGKKLEGFGGWLVLVAIGLIANPIFMAVGLIQDVLPAFSGGTWARLTGAGSPNYHQLWAPLLIMEVSGTSLFILFSLALLVLFLMKRSLFPVSSYLPSRKPGLREHGLLSGHENSPCCIHARRINTHSDSSPDHFLRYMDTIFSKVKEGQEYAWEMKTGYG